MVTVKLTRDEARLIDRAICDAMEAIRTDIKRGRPTMNYLEEFAKCRAILRKLDCWEG